MSTVVNNYFLFLKKEKPLERQQLMAKVRTILVEMKCITMAQSPQEGQRQDRGEGTCI